MRAPVVVIGGGIVGSAIAWELARGGTQVILVDRDASPSGATAFSFAAITAFDESSTDLYLLKCLGLLGWNRWQKEFGEELGFHADGEIRWAEEPSAAKELGALLERAERRGYPAREISAAEIEKRLPGSAPGGVLVASFAARDGQVDPLKAIEAIREAFVLEGGASLIGRATLGFGPDGLEVTVSDESLVGATVVLATGAETSTFLERLGWRLPMESSPGLLVRTKPLPPIVTGTVYVAPPEGPPVHLRQLTDGRVLLGERSQDYVVRAATERHARQLLEQAAPSFPALWTAEIDRVTVEWRPMPLDHTPMLGRLPGLPEVYVAVAHSGVTLAPAIAESVAAELGGEVDPRLEPFRPGRYATREAEVFKEIESAFADGMQ